MPFPHVLANRRVISTRPEAAMDGELETAFRTLGAEVLPLPMIELRPMAFSYPEPANFTWLFFTSRQAVHGFFGQGDASDFQKLPIACVGPVTAEALTRYGRQADFVSPRFDAQSAAEAFAWKAAGRREAVLWPCGNLANQDLTQILEAAGMSLTPLLVYETKILTHFPAEATAFLKKPVDLVVFTSPSAVQGFHQAWQEARLGQNRYQIACLGPKTTLEAERLLGHADIQAEPATLAGLTDAIRRAYGRHSC